MSRPQQFQPLPLRNAKMNRLLKTNPLVLAISLRCGREEIKTPSPTGMLHSTFPPTGYATCQKLRLPAVTELMQRRVPDHRTPSPPRKHIGDPTRARPRTCAFQVTA